MNIIGSFKFHEHRGRNIELSSGSTVATRTNSFKHGLIFSSRPLAPGEIFLIEITATDDSKWSGGLRMGLSQLSPDVKSELPPYAAPDLCQMGHTWTTHVSDTPCFEDKQKVEGQRAAVKASGTLTNGVKSSCDTNLFDYVVTKRGATKRIHFVSPKFLEDSDPFASSQKRIGSRIGVFYKPITENTAEWSLLINGQELHYAYMVMSYNTQPVWAVVDVYGQTTQVKTVQVEDTLTGFCRSLIRKNVSLDKVTDLPISWALKNYLRQF